MNRRHIAMIILMEAMPVAWFLVGYSTQYSNAM